MAEVILAAEVGRPLGSRAVRRLRREGKIPGVVYGHGTDPLRSPWSARELRVALNGEAGANELLSLDTGSETFLTLARELQRHPVAQTVTHVDFSSSGATRSSRPTCRSILVGEALEVHHGDGLVDQQMFTLCHQRAARPTSRPSSRSTSARSTIGDASPGRRPRAAERRHDRRRPRVRRRHRPAAACRGGRGGRRGRRGRGGRGCGRRGDRQAAEASEAAPTRARPCAALRPVGAPGHPGRPAGRRAGQPGRGVRRQPPQRGVRRGRSSGPAPRGGLRAEKGVAARVAVAVARRAPGRAGRPDHLHERVRPRRARPGHAVRHRRTRPPSWSCTTSSTCRRARCGSRSAADWPATTGSVRSSRTCTPTTSCGCASASASRRARRRARHTCLRRPPKAEREVLRRRAGDGRRRGRAHRRGRPRRGHAVVPFAPDAMNR